MSDLTLSTHGIAAAARVGSPVAVPCIVPAPPAQSMPALASGPDPIADLETRLDIQYGLWSSRRVRAALVARKSVKRLG